MDLPSLIEGGARADPAHDGPAGTCNLGIRAKVGGAGGDRRGPLRGGNKPEPGSGGDDASFFKRYLPNPHVYRLMRVSRERVRNSNL